MQMSTMTDARAWTGAAAQPAHVAQPLRTAIVGYGYWGPNLARNAAERPELELCALCELDESRVAQFRRVHPGVATVRHLDALLSDPDIEALVIATPPATHGPLAERALSAGKHVLVEKPLATSAAQANALVTLAEQTGLVVMPGHTFLYSPAVNVVRELVHDGVLGEVYFVTSSRMNLGKYQRDGVVCDLAPHDLSILLYCLASPLRSVAACAQSVFQHGVPETAFLNLVFEGGTSANVQISWLAPRKMRQMVLVGSRRMVQYDDTASDEPIRIYDRGMDFTPPANFGEYQLTYRAGDVVIPRVGVGEPLALELADFARAVRTGELPRSNAALGLQIVSALEAADASLRRNGSPVALGEVAQRAVA
jgi:predicted dehydrogenase